MRGFLKQTEGNRQGIAWPQILLGGLSLLVVGICMIVAIVLERDAALATRQLEGGPWRIGAQPPALTAMHQAQAALGYEGFLGDLQKFLTAPTLQGAQQMRSNLSNAQQAIMTLGTFNTDKDADLRLPVWQAVLTLYQQALGRAEQSLTSGQTPDPALFLPLYHAAQSLAALSAETEGALRAQALATLQDDNDALRHLVWIALGASLLLVVASWATLQGAYQAPLRRLAESLTGPGRLKPATKLWGTDRNDAIGDVARAAESLRQHLLNIPDLSVAAPNGDTYHLNFTGNPDAGPKSLFEALVGKLALAANSMQAAELPQMLGNVEMLCKALAVTVKLTHDDLARASSAIEATSQTLQANGIAHDSRLTELAKALEARAATVAEIARMTGAQAQSSLKDIVGAQLQLKMAANQGTQLFTQYGGTIEEISERMSAATNLMRSGGKVLQETVDSVRTRMMDATSALTQTDARLSTVIEENRLRLDALSQQAQELLSRGSEGQAALAQLATSSEKIMNVANRLSEAEGTLVQATQAIAGHGTNFTPLADQLQALHHQLAAKIGDQLAQQLATHRQMMAQEESHKQAVLVRLDTHADRLDAAVRAVSSVSTGTDFSPILDKLANMTQLTDGLSGLVTQLQQAMPQLQALNKPAPLRDEPMNAVDFEAIAGLRDALTAGTQATEVSTLRLNANLQLVQEQIGTLLANTSGGQAELLPHIEAMQRSIAQLRQQSATGVDEVEAAVARLVETTFNELNAKVEAQYQHFTGALTGFITKFEAALAAPVETVSGEEAAVPAGAMAILNRLRANGTENGEAAPITTETTLKDAIGRITQIKRMTNALASQVNDQLSQNLAEVALGEPLSSDPRELAEQAKTLIADVMDAISDLSAAASAITETADKLDRQA